MLKSRVYPSLLLVTISLSAALSAQAQIVPASADSTNTLVNQTGNTFFITGGTQTGTNLFHSFQQLGLTQGQIAHFLSPPSIQTILGRVVGGEASVIDGLIRVTGSQANLFLMNPAGIVFGQNARLDVPGSFTATTASAIGIGNGWFNAVGSNDYAALVGTPDHFAMTAPQSGAIINMGNLAPGQGQRLTLVGGTVINTGTLSAPGGTVVVATVPGEALVRISQEGSLLSLELPVTSRMALNPLPFSPQTLPQLLTGHGLGNATGVTVEDGVVSLTGAGIRVENGDVVTKGITAQTASLSSSNNLTLVESQVQTTFDLNLLAANTVWGRDSATGAIALQAGRNLTIQGDQAVDIFALNHPESRLRSGNNMVLRSASTIQGDAHYMTGGDLRFEQLNGNAGSVSSSYDPIVLAVGDVTLGDYTGASLHVLAGGRVTMGNVYITSGGTGTTTINPDNFTSYNGNPANTFATLAAIVRSDRTPLYVNVTPTLDGTNTIQRVPQPTDQLIIDGRNATLDVRSGINWSALGGLPAEIVIPPGSVTPVSTSTAAPVSSDITISSIQIGNTSPSQSGTVLLTNQYYPNTALAGGAIQVTGEVPGGVIGNPSILCQICSNLPPAGQFGVIVIDSRSTIALGNVQDFTGVNVDLRAVGDLTTGRLRVSGPGSGSSSIPIRTSVVLNSTTGNIQVSSIDAGANGIDIRAAGLFQATSVFDATFLFNAQPGPIVPSSPGTPLGNFLVSRGISTPPDRTILIFDNSLGQNVGLLARTSTSGLTPITIQSGDGSRLLINESFPAGAGTNLVVVRGGDAAFYSGPQVAGRLVPGNDPYVSKVPPSPRESGIYETITPANFPFETEGLVYVNEQYSALIFGSPGFPADASGIAGAITFSGIDATLYGVIQNRAFPAIINSNGGRTGGGDTGGGVTGGGDTGGGVTGGSSIPLGGIESSGIPLERIEGETIVGRADSQNIQRQLTNQRQDSACNPSATGVINPNNSVTRSEGNVFGAGSIAFPCAPTEDNAQILKILNEPSSR